ncbi:hypothetical protein L195_g063733, partial [Trifolium pratense]
RSTELTLGPGRLGGASGEGFVGVSEEGFGFFGSGALPMKLLLLDAASKHLLAASMSLCKVATCPL